jgi:hypothetical protein
MIFYPDASVRNRSFDKQWLVAVFWAAWDDLIELPKENTSTMCLTAPMRE